ncbi:MAG: hypothetical protein NC253_14370 [Ruminococcus sp.]|nr:hypothetical protein [Ruminococcus sp.]MCM1382328.1 hypothetical protein [Muribaculaceae bacterium]MCM1480949.1 hypothetical protein [Muribaculaceae bacterium]
MEAKFSMEKKLLKIDIAAHILMIFVLACLTVYFKNIAVFVLAIIAIVIKDVIMYTDYHGKIIADESGVTVVKTFFGRAAGKKFIEYGKIQSTDCGVETVGNRLRTVSHTMIFTIKMKDGSKIVLYNIMKIGASFPAEQPEKYKKYLSEQPLMQISHYIDGKLHLNTSA